jgi:hypothetical protein
MRVLYTASKTDLRISSVNGTAFLDFTADPGIPDSAAGQYFQITDVAGKKLSGYLKARGTGETYLDIIGGTDPSLLNGNFASAEPPGVVWTRGVGWTIASGAATDSGGGGSLSINTGTYTGKLFRSKFDVVALTSGSIAARLAGTASGTFRTALGTNLIDYLTGTAGTSGFAFISEGSVLSIDNASWQQALTPSSYGWTLTNTPGGSTYNVNVETGFAFNSASAYIVTVYQSESIQVNNPIIAHGTTTAGVMKISAVDGVAFIDPSSDVVASAAFLAAVKHNDKIVIRSKTNGAEIFGYAKAAGAGETLDVERLTTWVNNGNTYETFTSSGSDITSAIESNTNGFSYSNIATQAIGNLMKLVSTVTLNSGTAPVATLYSGTGITEAPNASFGTLTAGANAIYRTATGVHTHIDFLNYLTNGNWSATGNSLKKVLTPAATGITISTLPGGTTMNWSVKSATFTYNDLLGYDWQIVSSVPNGKTADRIIAQGTLTGNLATLAGGSFISNPSVDLSVHGNKPRMIKLWDSAGKLAYGYAGAAGLQAGETVLDIIGGTDPALKNGDMSSDEPPGTTWESKAAQTVITGGSAVISAGGTANGIIMRQTNKLSMGGLYKSSVGATFTSGRFYLQFGGTNGVYPSYAGTTAPISNAYVTGIGPHLEFHFATSVFVGTLDNVVLQQVLTPSSTGIWLTDGSGASSFKSIETGFNPNSASFTYQVIEVGAIPTAASAFHASMVNGTAFFFHDTLDFSTFAVGASGKYLVALYDSSNRVAWGYGKAVGGGETPGANLANGYDFTVGFLTQTGQTINSATQWTGTQAGGIYKSMGTFYRGALYKTTLAGSVTAGAIQIRSTDGFTIASGFSTMYKTNTNTGDAVAFLLHNNSASTNILASIVTQQVLTPPVTGLTITSTPDGTVYNWANITTGFDANNITSVKVWRTDFASSSVDALQDDQNGLYLLDDAGNFLLDD